jgi:hypothetical protein
MNSIAQQSMLSHIMSHTKPDTQAMIKDYFSDDE